MANDDAGAFEEFGAAAGGDILSVREETERRAPRRAILIRRVGAFLARPAVFLALVAFHVVWFLLNLRGVVGYVPWDPYPFAFLATLASALAPFLSLLILMRQQREAHIAELRDEVDLHVTLYNQRQLAAVVRMLREVAQRLDARVPVPASALEHLGQPLDPQCLMETVRRQLDEAEQESHE